MPHLSKKCNFAVVMEMTDAGSVLGKPQIILIKADDK
jgi:hypothetical protein